MPGHTTSWFVGYPELASAPGPYSIERKWGIFQPTMDPAREDTYKFLDQFLGEMAALFPDRLFPHRRRRSGPHAMEAVRLHSGFRARTASENAGRHCRRISAARSEDPEEIRQDHGRVGRSFASGSGCRCGDPILARSGGAGRRREAGLSRHPFVRLLPGPHESGELSLCRRSADWTTA